MAKKLCEHTYGAHTYMRIELESGFIAEIDVYYRQTGETYRTNADHDTDTRNEIIKAFRELF